MSSNLKLESITSKADTVLCRIVENNDWFAAVGITDLVHDPVLFVIDNGRIKKIIGYPSEKTGREIQAAIGELYQWSQEAQDSTINNLIQNGQFIYSAEAAKKWLKLFSRWRDSDTLNKAFVDLHLLTKNIMHLAPACRQAGIVLKMRVIVTHRHSIILKDWSLKMPNAPTSNRYPV